MEASAVKLAKAACPGNIHGQGSYISGYLQAVDMVYGWEAEDVEDLACAPSLQPYSMLSVEGTLQD